MSYLNSLLIGNRPSAVRSTGRVIRQGAAAVEFIIVLPLVIVLALSAVDFGRFAFVAIAMDNAARVGAERGATRSFTSFTRSTWETDLKARVTEELADVQSGWMNDVQITVTTTPLANNLSRCDISLDGKFAPLVNWPFMSGLLPLHRQISFRQFR